MTQTLKRSPFSRDRMNMSDPIQVGRTAFHVVNAMQYHPVEVQILGQALAFMAACERFGIRPADAFETVTRMYSESGKPPEVLALEDYMREDVR